MPLTGQTCSVYMIGLHDITIFLQVPLSFQNIRLRKNLDEWSPINCSCLTTSMCNNTCTWNDHRNKFSLIIQAFIGCRWIKIKSYTFQISSYTTEQFFLLILYYNIFFIYFCTAMYRASFKLLNLIEFLQTSSSNWFVVHLSRTDVFHLESVRQYN